MQRFLRTTSSQARLNNRLHEPGLTCRASDKGLGHFPMCEDPERLIGYRLPVLEQIRAL
jgi:hypothetical protein